MEPTTPSAAPTPAPTSSNKKRLRKWLIIAGVVVIAVVALGAIRIVSGRKCFQHSFGSNCEFPAWDGGKTCVSDAECSSGLCVYETNRYLDPDRHGGDIQPKTSSGSCDTFEGDNDGVQICHRPSPTGPLQCFMNISRNQTGARRVADK